MTVIDFKPRKPITAELLTSARELAHWYEKEQARPGTAAAIYNLVSEIEALREAANAALDAINHASAAVAFSQLKSTVLLLIAEKLAPVIDHEIEQRMASGNDEDWSSLQVLSDELHAAIKLAKG
jgi:hypothetical protein